MRRVVLVFDNRLRKDVGLQEKDDWGGRAYEVISLVDVTYTRKQKKEHALDSKLAQLTS